MKRFARLHKLAEIRRDIHAFPGEEDRILLNAIIQGLPPQHKGVYEYAVEYPGKLTSAFVAMRWNIQQNHAAMLLQELWQFGLLERSEDTDERGKRYLYTLARQQPARASKPSGRSRVMMDDLIKAQCPYCKNSNLDKMTLIDTVDVDEDFFFWMILCHLCGEYFKSSTIVRPDETQQSE